MTAAGTQRRISPRGASSRTAVLLYCRDLLPVRALLVRNEPAFRRLQRSKFPSLRWLSLRVASLEILSARVVGPDQSTACRGGRRGGVAIRFVPCGVLRVGEGRGEVSVQSAVLDEVQIETEVREALVGADQVLLQLANTGLFLQSWNSGKRHC